MEQSRSGKKRVTTGIVVAVLLGIAVLAGLVWLVVWALRGSSGVESQAFDANRSAWESAMAKASVEATFPGGPVDLDSVRATGSHPFEATFTTEEIEALLAVYRYEAPQQGSQVSLDRVSILLPAAGEAAIRGRIQIDGNAYSARASGPVEWDGGVVIDDREADISVEGFTLTGARKADALNAIETYLNGLLAAAPGLAVKEASVTADGLSVRGTAPVKLEHPRPLEQ